MNQISVCSNKIFERLCRTNFSLAIIKEATGAFILQFLIACTNPGNHHDDLLAIMQLFLNQHPDNWMPVGEAQTSIEVTFLNDIYRILGVHFDYFVDSPPQQLFKNQMTQRCLSMQMSLGFRGERKHRSIPAKVAWTLLNIRCAALIFTFAFKNPRNAPGSEGEAKNPGTPFYPLPFRVASRLKMG